MKQNDLKNLATLSVAKIISEDSNFSELPFKHLYIDNFFTPEFANTLLKVYLYSI